MAGALRNIAPRGLGVCPHCWTFHDPMYRQCPGCVGGSPFDIAVPISYAPMGDQLALALRGYKDETLYRTRYHHGMRLSAILWRFLIEHEAHIAAAAHTDTFTTVCVVPSKTSQDDEARPGLRAIVGAVVHHTSSRFERLLYPTDATEVGRFDDPSRYRAARPLEGESVLLIDDTWVTGSSARSAGAALREAGASHLACLVIGRWLRLDFGGPWGTIGDHYRRLPASFDWTSCAAEF